MATFIAPRRKWLAGAVALSAAVLMAGRSIAAPPTSITLDGSLGAAGPVNGVGNIFTITPGMGKTVGSNLFQSFGTFNLGTGDTAAFQAGGASNIIARVTGGSASSIDGTLTSPVNLFFINPAGVMFGSGAQVNVTGAFVVSTANYAKLGDGNIFYADVNHPIADQGLTSAPVSAFGFLTATPQPVTFVGTNVGAQPTSTVTGIQVIAGDITLNGAALLTPQGQLSFFSAAGSGEVPFNLTLSPTQYSGAAMTVTKFGNIGLTNGARAEIDGNGGGAVLIRGGKLTVDHSDITSGNFTNSAGGNIAVQADEVDLTNAGFIATEAFGNGNSGSVTVEVADKLEASGTGSEIFTDVEGSGVDGMVNVNAGNAIDLNGGAIFASTDGMGNAGVVQVTAGSMSMEGNSRLSSISDGGGNSGTVNLTLRGPLTMTDTAGIVADTYRAGNGGSINATAAQISMSGQTLISANSVLGTGNGGDINVRTGALTIQGTGTQPPNSLGIVAQSFTPGNAGVIDVAAGPLSLSGGAIISSSSFAGGQGGSVMVTASEAMMSGLSQISASSKNTDAGSVSVYASDSLTLSGGSSVSTSAALNGGDIDVKVGRLLYLYDSNIQAFAGVASTPGSRSAAMGGTSQLIRSS